MNSINKRFDERDNVFSRENLVPGSQQFERYYREHPDLLEIDDYIRNLPGLGAFMPAVDMHMFNAEAWLMKKLGEKNFIDDKPSQKKIDISPERAAIKVKSLARLLGADIVGISKTNEDYAYSHRGRDVYKEEPWGMSIEVKHKYTISLGFREKPEMIHTAPHHSEMLETGAVYFKSTVVSIVLAKYIRLLGYPARAHQFRNYQMLSVPPAVDAGLGELARCGFLLTREFGNCLRLSSVTTDLPLDIDKPVDIGVQDFCTVCKLCAEACPSGAIPFGEKELVRGVYKWKLDEVKCISYWNKIGSDCGICIASCPWSLPDKWWHRLSADAASKSLIARRILLWLYPLVFGKYKAKPMPNWVDPKQKIQSKEAKDLYEKAAG